jgi:1-acyl-sn-glycerol-3-phosphate acyltransferase
MSDVAAPARAVLSGRFFPFFVTQLLGAFNDNFLKNAMVLFISATGASAFGFAPAVTIFLCHGVFVLPFFLFSATAGQLADRHDKSTIVRLVKAAEVAIMIVGAVGFVMHSLPILLCVLAAMGVHSAFLGPVKYGILPELLPSDSLVVGNAWVEMGTFLAILGGTIGGGLLVVSSANGPVYVSVVLVIIALVGLGTSLRIPRLAPASPDVVVQWDLVRPTREVLRITAARRPVFNAVLAISWFWFVGTCFLSVFPTYAKQTLGSDESVVTLMLSTFCVGIALGSMLTERISGPSLELALVPIGALGMSLGMLDLYLIGAHPLETAGAAYRTVATFIAEPWAKRLLADLFVIAIFGGFFTVPLYAFIAKRADPKERARVVAGNNVLNSLLMVMATFLLIGLQRAGLSVPEIILVVSVLNLLVAIYIESVVPEFVLRFVAWILTRVMYRLRASGLENVPSEGPAVIVCNHVSFVDWMIIGGLVRRPIRFVMDHRIAAMPFVSFAFERGKTIPIAPARENPELLEKAFERVAAELRDGELVCIFPEGKLTADGSMNPFKAGIERIIRDTPVPVIPMALDGLWGSMFSRKDGGAMSRPPRRFRAKLRLVVGKPVAPSAVTAAVLETRVKDMLAGEASTVT